MLDVPESVADKEVSSAQVDEKGDQEPVDYENDGQFYVKAQKYWSGVDATINGMLGGFSQISSNELNSSRLFLDELYRSRPCPERKVALDCGAGIGRVSKGLLLPYFEKVDLVEQDENFCKTARTYIGGDNTERLGAIHNTGLQDFVFEEGKYDVIWCQWVLGHLKDTDLMDFLRRAQTGLKSNGFIVIKENFTRKNDIEIDEEDSSVTRPLRYTKDLITRAGLRVAKTKRQTNMPDGLYPVHMLALKPIRRSVSNK